KYPKRRCPHAPDGAPVESMNMDKTNLPASTFIQNIPFHYRIQSRNFNIRLSNTQSEHLAFNNHKNINNTPSWWRMLFRRWGLEKEKKKFKDIKMYTDFRCKMLQNDQGRMLRNLLDKPFRSIKLDRILENINGQSVLILDPTEVKRKTQQHFQTQYQDRNTANEKVTEDWEQIYLPKEEIKDEWLNSNSSDGDFALLRLKQGIILANIDRKFWQDGNWDSLKKIWKFNLTCLTFLKAKRLGLTFQSLQEPWVLHGAGETFRSMLGVKNFTKTCQ
ncbi:12298_t:CDS:2, partial [Gigaspora margarita]